MHKIINTIYEFYCRAFSSSFDHEKAEAKSTNFSPFSTRITFIRTVPCFSHSVKGAFKLNKIKTERFEEIGP